MSIRIIQIAIATVIAAAVSGQLPRLLYNIRLAQLQLLKDSESKNWGRPFILPIEVSRQVKPREHR